MTEPHAPRARIGVLGGSFDPVHWGHLHAALLAREAARLDAVLFVPAAAPPHKPGRSLAPDTDRLRMLSLALVSEPRTAVSTLELREGASRYTADTLDALAREHPGVRLHFILGVDSLIDLPGWKDPERILSGHRVVAVDRPGFDPALIDPELAVRCRLVTGNPMAVSATGIRERAARGLSIRHLVPGPVADYIEERGLYGPGTPVLAAP
jgi:nicotinate-nucleotide adenylyltransferase